MKHLHCTQNQHHEQARFQPKRIVYGRSHEKPQGTSEKPLEPQAPINLKLSKEQLSNITKTNDKRRIVKSGEELYEDLKINLGPLKIKQKTEIHEQILTIDNRKVYISVPKDLKNKEKYGDKEPHVIFYCHGNLGDIKNTLYDKNIAQYVQEMRDDGDPVIIVIPENHNGHFGWESFKRKETFTNIMAKIEEISGVENPQITLAGHSGGGSAIENILRSCDPKDPKNIYHRIQSLALFDAAYGTSPEAFIEFGKDPTKKLASVYTESLAKENQRMKSALSAPNSINSKDRIRIFRTKNDDHLNSPKFHFKELLS